MCDGYMLARGATFLLELQDRLPLILFVPSQQRKGTRVNRYISEQANPACVNSVVSESLLMLKENLKQSLVYCMLMHIELENGFKSFAFFCGSMERRLIYPLDALG